MSKAKRATKKPAPAPASPTCRHPLDCQDDFNKIADAAGVLWFIWDSVANGTLQNPKMIDSALITILAPMDRAIERLGKTLELEVERFERPA